MFKSGTRYRTEQRGMNYLTNEDKVDFITLAPKMMEALYTEDWKTVEKLSAEITNSARINGTVEYNEQLITEITNILFSDFEAGCPFRLHEAAEYLYDNHSITGKNQAHDWRSNRPYALPIVPLYHALNRLRDNGAVTVISGAIDDYRGQQCRLYIINPVESE